VKEFHFAESYPLLFDTSRQEFVPKRRGGCCGRAGARTIQRKA
jgi:hypothetical protein